MWHNPKRCGTPEAFSGQFTSRLPHIVCASNFTQPVGLSREDGGDQGDQPGISGGIPSNSPQTAAVPFTHPREVGGDRPPIEGFRRDTPRG